MKRLRRAFTYTKWHLSRWPWWPIGNAFGVVCYAALGAWQWWHYRNLIAALVLAVFTVGFIMLLAFSIRVWRREHKYVPPGGVGSYE